MTILFLMCSYNELPLLKLKHTYCHQNGLQMFIIDNMSNDGSLEYLEHYDIPHTSIDTDGCFDLRPLLAEMNVQLHRIKPDWFIYEGMDVFPVFRTSIRDCIKHAELNGFNVLSMPQILIFETGEGKNNNPFTNHFKYRVRYEQMALIAKYTDRVFITPDYINYIDEPCRYFICDGALFEAHFFNTPEKRADVFARRRKAWKNGMPSNWGTHYLEEEAAKFKPPMHLIKDIKENTELFELYKKLSNI